VGTWAFMSFAAYQICETKRHYEKAGVQRAVELMEERKEEKIRKFEEAKKARRRAKEEREKQEELAKQEAAKKSWRSLKFW
jgi:cytochrome c oxidase assembly protein subunit 20